MFCLTLQVVAGLNTRAFQCFSSAVRKAEEEIQSLSADHLNTDSIIDAYMILANFCDTHLRKKEEGSAGEQKNQLFLPVVNCAEDRWRNVYLRPDSHINLVFILAY